MKTTQTKMNQILMLLAAVIVLLGATSVQALTFTAAATGDWNLGATWGFPGNDIAGSGYPGSADTAVISTSGRIVTVNATTEACTTLTITLGTLQNNGTLTVSGNTTGAGSLIQGASSTLNLAGTFTVTTVTATASGNTVNYNGAAQTAKAVAYQKLIFSGSGAKTAASGTSVGSDLTINGTATATFGAAFTVGGNLLVAQSSATGTALQLNNTANSVQVTGTITVTLGTFKLGGQSDTSVFTGLFTVNGGTFDSNGGQPVFKGGFTYSSGSLSDASGASGRFWLFSVTANQTISGGTFAIPSTIKVNTGVTLLNSATALTVNGGGNQGWITGPGIWTQDANSGLILGSTGGGQTPIDVTTFNASASGNTVTYSAGAITVKAATYYNLTMSAAGVNQNMTGSTVNNDLTITGAGTIASGTWPTSIGGTLVYSSSASSTFPNGYSLSKLNQTSGTLVAPSGQILTITGTGAAWTRSAGTFTASATSTVSFTGAAPAIAGAATTTFVNLTLNNSTGATLTTAPTINGTLTLTAGTATGNLTMAAAQTIVRTAGGISGTVTFGATVDVNYNGSSQVTTGPEIPATTTVLRNLIINNAGGVLLGANATSGNSSGTLTLTTGQLGLNGNTLTLATGSTISRNTGTLSAAPTFAGTVNVTYTGSTAATTGAEIPTSTTALSALAINNTSAGGITLGANITANGAVTLATGTKLNVPTTMEIKSTLVMTGTGLLAVSNGGILKNFGASTITSSATTLTFASGAKFQHAVTTTTGTVPTAGWNANSTLEIMNTAAIGGTPPSGLAQSFGNVTWDNTQSSGCNLVGVNLNSIAGTFTVKNTGTFDLRLGSTQSPTESWGNLVLQGGTLTTSSGAGVPIMNVAGGVTFSGGALTIVNAAPLNIGGDLTKNTGTFTPGTGTVTFNGTGAQAINGSATTQTFNSLRVNKASNDLSISGSVTEAIVNGTLTLTTGKIVTGANKVTVASTGTISGGGSTSYVYGNFDRGLTTSSTSATFPVGDSSVYAPVSMASVVCTANGDLVVSTVADKNSTGAFSTSGLDASKNVNRDWTISAINSYAQSAGNVTFNFVAGDVQGSMSTSTDIVKKYNGSIWTAPTVASRTSTSITVSGISSFSDWIIGELPTPSFSGVTASQSITYGTASITLGGTLSASGPYYPVNGSTVTATINGNAVNGTVTNATGGFSINYNHASLATDSVGSSPYTITYSFTGDANVAAAANDTSTSLTVTMATPTLSVANSPVTYDGSPHSATVNGSVAGVVSNVKYDGSSTAPTAAGTYAVTADFTPTDTANYNSLSDASAGSFVINKATPTITTAPTASAIIYGQTLTNSTLSGGAATNTSNGASVAGSFAFTTPGLAPLAGSTNVSVTFTPTDADNYNPATATVSVTVNPAALTITASDTNKVYGQTMSFAGTEFMPTGLINGDSVTNVTLDSDGATNTALANTYAITVTNAMGGGLANYVISYVNGMLTVSKATPVLTAPTATAITYGQTLADSSLSGGAATNASNGTPVAGSFAFTTPATAPGVGTAPQDVTFTPADTANYSNATTTVSVTVNPACTAPSIVGGIDPNGTNVTAFSPVVFALTNVTGTAPLYYQWRSNNVDIASATNSSYTNLSVTVADAGNYVCMVTNDCGAITSSVVVLTVNPVLLTITANADSKTYGDVKTYGSGSSAYSITSGTLNNTDAISTVTLTDTGSGGVATAAAGGTYNLTPSAAVFTAGSAANYTITYATGLLAVNQRPVNLTGTRVYDGTTNAAAAILSVANAINGDTVTVDSGTGGLASANSGPRALTSVGDLAIGGPSVGNYTLTGASGSVTIGTALVVPSVTVSSKVYDGNTNATIATRSLTGAIGGDDVNLGTSGTASFTDKNVGTGKPVNVVGLSLSGTTAGNYVLNTTSTNASADITQATVVPNMTVSSKVYDGNTNATIATRSLTGAVGGDDVVLVGGTAFFEAPNVGTGKPVDVAGLSLSGTTAGNYVLSTTSTNATADITQALVVPSVTVNSKVYDSNTNATIATRSLTGVIGGDDVNLGTSGTASYTDKNVGTNKLVNVAGLSLSGTTAGNYVLNTTFTNASADITARTLIVSATGVNKVYDGTTNATVNLSDDRVSGDSLTIVYTAAFEDSNVGTGKPVNVTGISITGGADQNNYALGNTTTSTTADITSASVSVTVSSSLNPSGFGDSVTFTATVSSSNAGGNVIFKANGTPLGTNILSIGTATNVTVTLLRGTNTITAEYSGDGNYLGSTNALSGGQVVTNHPPTANLATYSHPSGIQLQIVLTDLATNWTDTDGDTVVLTGVNSSTNGASITFDSNFIYYPAAIVNDQFTYTISDGYGGTNTGVVNVVISASTNVTQIITGQTLNGDGSLTIYFESAPGSTNVVETTSSLSPPIIWTPVSTNTAGANGLWQFTDPSPANPTFYRSMRQP